MRLECGVGFRQLRTCRRTRPGELCATSGNPHSVLAKIAARQTKQATVVARGVDKEDRAAGGLQQLGKQ
jgi:hypothetical protein